MNRYYVVLVPTGEWVITVEADSAVDALYRTEIPEGWECARVEMAEADDTISEVVT